ncbi:hypothetical protein SKAU_G00233800 [Synaphobranchus kaupii]|uniref:Uncharacterized protein n=1 Tax=Synaphobranchus kaupii TaxID=118154 RepID=A0A9Q1F673_SYNKA|nr:hypothetical protein SKAU_G00233800 [Synaphobranchus kaupii]
MTRLPRRWQCIQTNLCSPGDAGGVLFLRGVEAGAMVAATGPGVSRTGVEGPRHVLEGLLGSEASLGVGVEERSASMEGLDVSLLPKIAARTRIHRYVATYRFRRSGGRRSLSEWRMATGMLPVTGAGFGVEQGDSSVSETTAGASPWETGSPGSG